MKLPFVNDKPVRLIELFGGIGSQAMALTRLGIDFEHYRLVEFDKYPVASYNAIHGTNFEPIDITKIHGSDLGIVETNKFTYLLTYSFPCQDLSVAGKQQGMSKGSNTRSGLLWEVERLLNETEYLPQLLLMENVPQVHSKKNLSDFEDWINFLESKGYSNFYQDLNAKDYGVAQNRNRCFMVSILGDFTFSFPKPKKLDKTMKDYLEDTVDEKYYINNDKADKLIQNLIDNGSISVERERPLTSQSKTLEEKKLQTALKQDMTPESVTSNQTELVYVSQQATAIKMNEKGIAHTLMARDYKGYGNQEMNGVIEWKK